MTVVQSEREKLKEEIQIELIRLSGFPEGATRDGGINSDRKNRYRAAIERAYQNGFEVEFQSNPYRVAASYSPVVIDPTDK